MARIIFFREFNKSKVSNKIIINVLPKLKGISIEKRNLKDIEKSKLQEKYNKIIRSTTIRNHKREKQMKKQKLV